MISSYKEITNRYLKANKKRALLTIIGIVLSVALISTIGLFFKGMQQVELDNARDNYGSFHVMYKDVTDKVFEQVVNNPKVGKYGYYKVDEEIKLNDNIIANKLVTTNKALDLLPFKVKEGRMPKNEQEVVVERWAISYISKSIKVGDKVNLGDKEYTLVGILEDSASTQDGNKARIITKNDNLSKEDSILLVQVKSGTNLRKAVNELTKIGDEKKVSENGPVLRLEGAGTKNDGMGGLLSAIVIIVSIVVVCTVAVIYNSFQISVVERMKEFGLLRAVGTTPKQIRFIVLKEATILAFIAVPIGLIFGLIAITILSFVFKMIGSDSVVATKLVISPIILIVSFIVGIVSVYLSALLPAIFAGRISPLLAISSRNSITKAKIKKSENRIIKKLFGFEGAMAAKNIKRNRKRYRITVFSIVISIVLFITFSSFMDMTLTVTNEPNESRDMHFTIYNNDYDENKTNISLSSMTEEVKKLNSVKDVYKNYRYYYFKAAIDSSKELKEVKNIDNVYKSLSYNGKEQTLVTSSVQPFDDKSLEASKKYLVEGSIDKDKLEKENGVILIKKDKIYNEATKKKYLGPIANIKVGDKISIQYDEIANVPNQSEAEVKPKEFGEGKVVTVKVMGIVSTDPFDNSGTANGLKFITTEALTKKFIEKDKIEPTSLLIKIKDIKADKTAEEQIENLAKSNNSLYVYNQINGNKREKASTLMVQILIYGFITVISLISSVNIINTITTNIILRKREFAALKSIGLTQKGLKKMIVLEGILYAVAGTIYGSIIGCGLSYLLYKAIADVREFAWKIPIGAMIISFIAALIIGYLSVLSPLSRIKKTNLIEAIREE
ncbi:ABC transporter permease [Clostridium zeae]|uniref:ABC transporter permease n=1 Tax=Clostridium zeae TaxID=2759022 RepID=A0ABQ1E914_9CLOT|nr:FtsX-like permease family protein [Clostridium zeae]GFZ31292.1 ABC transporter permease [Clostridium zeae]